MNITAKVLISTLAIAGASVSALDTAQASCATGFVNVVGVYEYASNGSPYGYVYAIPEHALFPSYAYYFYSPNATGLAQARIALQNHNTLYLTGDTSACPTTGTYRYGGTLTSTYAY